MAKLDKSWIVTMAEAMQEVRITPEEAERMAAVLERFNATALSQYDRLSLEAEPSAFVRLLHAYSEREDGP